MNKKTIFISVAVIAALGAVLYASDSVSFQGRLQKVKSGDDCSQLDLQASKYLKSDLFTKKDAQKLIKKARKNSCKGTNIAELEKKFLPAKSTNSGGLAVPPTRTTHTEPQEHDAENFGFGIGVFDGQNIPTALPEGWFLLVRTETDADSNSEIIGNSTYQFEVYNADRTSVTYQIIPTRDLGYYYFRIPNDWIDEGTRVRVELWNGNQLVHVGPYFLAR